MPLGPIPAAALANYRAASRCLTGRGASHLDEGPRGCPRETPTQDFEGSLARATSRRLTPNYPFRAAACTIMCIENRGGPDENVRDTRGGLVGGRIRLERSRRGHAVRESGVARPALRRADRRRTRRSRRSPTTSIWSEGPLWDANRKTLLFSDIPRNVVMQWNADKGVSRFLEQQRLHRRRAFHRHASPVPTASPSTCRAA